MDDAPMEYEITDEGVPSAITPQALPAEGKTGIETGEGEVLLQDENAGFEPEVTIDLNDVGIITEEKTDAEAAEAEDHKDKVKSPSSEDISDPKKTATADESADKNSSFFTTIASILADEGDIYLTKEEASEVKTAEGFIETIKKTIKQNEYSNLNPAQQQALKAFEAGVPAQEYVKSQNDIQVLENIQEADINADSEEGKDLRINLMVHNYVTKGIAENEAENLANLQVDAGKDKEVALQAHKALYANAQIDIDARAKEKADKDADAVVRNNEYRANLKANITTADILPGVKLNPTMRDMIYNSVTTPASKRTDGRAMDAVMTKWTNDADYKVKVHAMDILTKGFTDLSPLFGGKVQTQSAIEKLNQLAKDGEFKLGGMAKESVQQTNTGNKSFIDRLA
tara:strand:+ start:21 stop:1220 length:1200 start_codon:yes stop_codon:yes gene_type:complete